MPLPLPCRVRRWFVRALVCCALLPSIAHATDGWLVLPMAARGVDPMAAQTFRDLLETELGRAARLRFVGPSQAAVCSNATCASSRGSALGARFAAYGVLGRLGEKIVATVTVIRVAGGGVWSSQRMTVDRIEDLEAVAERMAKAILAGGSTDTNAALGAITHKEARKDVRREADDGLVVRVGSHLPFLGGVTHGGVGVGADIGFWYEATDFSIEPRFGARFSVGDGDGAYADIVADATANWILTRSDVAPFVGLGGGLRYIWAQRAVTRTSGTIIQTTSQGTESDRAFGFGLTARAGLLLFRTYTMRMMIHADYGVAFVNPLDDGFPQSFTVGVGVIF